VKNDSAEYSEDKIYKAYFLYKWWFENKDIKYLYYKLHQKIILQERHMNLWGLLSKRIIALNLYL